MLSEKNIYIYIFYITQKVCLIFQ